jgi:rhodanese-related sulfurtransferase
MRRIDPATLRAWLDDAEELALLDAREEGEFSTGHLFWAVPCPLSQREIRARALLPRKSVRTVCLDDGSGLAERLADWLQAVGHSDVSVLAGGTAAWADAGYVVFSGINVPSKAFGEWVEHEYGTENVDPPELKAWLDEGRDMVVLDSRTFEEFSLMSIPRGISVPGGELVLRIGDIAPDPNTLVVVNCAGRTRSIMGAESLRRAGIPNRVVALRNGTMGWELAGYQAARGRAERFTPGTPASIALARQRAEGFAQRTGVGEINAQTLEKFTADPERTLYVLDVRDPAEFHVGHSAGIRNAPGGQLVQATDQWIGVRGARIVLLDTDGVRARMAGAWLRLMGHRDVYVVEPAADRLLQISGAPIPELEGEFRSIKPAALAARLDEAGLLVVDLARSVGFRAGHIAGARWGIRTRLQLLAPHLLMARTVVVTSPDSSLARLSLPELQGLTAADLLVLAGGTDAWRGSGLPLQADRTEPPDEACVDCALRPYDRNAGVAEAMRAYLSWEIALVDEIERDGLVHFGRDPGVIRV